MDLSKDSVEIILLCLFPDQLVQLCQAMQNPAIKLWHLFRGQPLTGRIIPLART